MNLRTACLVLVMGAALVAATPAAAEPAPGTAGWLYDPGKVVVIDLTLSPSAISELEAEPDEYVEGGFALYTTDGTPGGEEHLVESRDAATDPVGIRLKGSAMGSFRGLDGKAAFKLKFKQFGGSKFEGLKKLTLNNMVEDFSLIHETLAYTAFRGAGIPASRTGYADVRVNGQDYGLHLDIEDMDDVALERWFGEFDDPQHLYEGESGTDVIPGVYALSHEEGGYEVDEGDEANLEDLKALVEAVNSTEGAGWSAAVSSAADLAEMTRMWAVEKYVGHWDGYAGQEGAHQPNNYFLYSDPNGVFQMIPWGSDETFMLQHRLPFGGSAGLLFNKCMADPACKGLYREELESVRDAIAGLDLNALAASTAAFIKPWWEADPRLEHPDLVEEATEETEEFIAGRGAEADEWIAENTPAVEGTGSGGAQRPSTGSSSPAVGPGPGLKILSPHRRGRSTVIDVRLRVPGTGKATGIGTVGTGKRRLTACVASGRAHAPGVLVLRCHLSKQVRARLRRHRLTLTFRAHFVPTSGAPSAASRRIPLLRTS